MSVEYPPVVASVAVVIGLVTAGHYGISVESLGGFTTSPVEWGAIAFALAIVTLAWYYSPLPDRNYAFNGVTTPEATGRYWGFTPPEREVRE